MHERRLPVSTRHAFALAFDLAFRRDPFHSLIVPFVLRAPWLAALALLPSPEQATPGADIASERLLVWSLAAIGFLFSLLLVDAMLRFRARSAFNQPRDQRPAPIAECYASGLRRVPWLYLTELVRNFLLIVGLGAFVLPGIWLAHRLAFATEAVVLTEGNLVRAFQHSYHLAQRRFERWIEMMLVSAVLFLGVCLLGAIVFVLSNLRGFVAAGLVAPLFAIALLPVIQYAWTFFYLRLLESEQPVIQEVGPTYAAGDAPMAGPHPEVTHT